MNTWHSCRKGVNFPHIRHPDQVKGSRDYERYQKSILAHCRRIWHHYSKHLDYGGWNLLFKFPNHFAFGGVTGFSTVVSEISRWSASDFTFIVNTSLLVLGFIFLGKGFGIKTVYASMVMSISLSLLERVCPLSRPLTTEPLLELLFAIFLPAVGTAILFNLGASSGGTDIIAMILKKYTSLNIGTVLMLVDVAAVASSFFIFGPETGLFSTIGLAAKSLVIDDVIENLNLCKCFNIICDDPEPICDYIINTLHRSATVYHARGPLPIMKRP